MNVWPVVMIAVLIALASVLAIYATVPYENTSLANTLNTYLADHNIPMNIESCFTYNPSNPINVCIATSEVRMPTKLDFNIEAIASLAVRQEGNTVIFYKLTPPITNRLVLQMLQWTTLGDPEYNALSEVTNLPTRDVLCYKDTHKCYVPMSTTLDTNTTKVFYTQLLEFNIDNNTVTLLRVFT